MNSNMFHFDYVETTTKLPKSMPMRRSIAVTAQRLRARFHLRRERGRVRQRERKNFAMPAFSLYLFWRQRLESDAYSLSGHLKLNLRERVLKSRRAHSSWFDYFIYTSFFFFSIASMAQFNATWKIKYVIRFEMFARSSVANANECHRQTAILSPPLLLLCLTVRNHVQTNCLKLLRFAIKISTSLAAVCSRNMHTVCH